MISGIDLKTPILNQLGKIQDSHVTATISAGLDGISIAFGLEELGKKVTALSFALEGYESRDIRVAEARAKVFGWDFIGVDLPTDLQTLMDDMVYLAELGCESQTDFECAYPFLYVIESAETKHITTGLGADEWFGLTRKINQHYVRKGKWKQAQEMAWKNREGIQEIVIDAHAESKERTIHRPYLTEEVFAKLRGQEWKTLNKPHEKQPIRDAFSKQFSRIRTYPHTNFNCGDSGFRQHFDRLLTSPLNTRGSRHVRGIYNDLVRRYGVRHEIDLTDESDSGEL